MSSPNVIPDPLDLEPPHLQQVLRALAELGVPASQMGPGRWRTRCPHHDEADMATLDIQLGPNGKVNLWCGGGSVSGRRCSELEILDTLGLDLPDLWVVPNKTSRPEDQAVVLVSRSHPCRICRSTDSCTRSPDGRVELCRTTGSSRDGRKGTKKTGADGSSYWLYFRGKAPAQVVLDLAQDETSPSRRLSPSHRELLKSAGLTDQTIQASGVSTRHGHDTTDLLGWERGTGNLGSALVFPYRTHGQFDGYITAVPDNPRIGDNGVPVTSEATVGHPEPRAYIPTGTTLALTDTTKPLLLCLGEIKAMRADQDGFSTLGLAGPWAWRKPLPDGQTGIITDLENIQWPNKKVFLVFEAVDDDTVQAEYDLAQALTQRGATVRSVRFPQDLKDEAGMPVTVHLEDYLSAHGPAGFTDLLGQAQRPQNPLESRPEENDTDWSNARSFVSLYGSAIRYCHEKRMWVVRKGTGWVEDRKGEAVRKAKQTVARLYQESLTRSRRLAEKLKGLPDDDPNAALIRAELARTQERLAWARESESTARLDALLLSAQSEEGMSIDPADIHQDTAGPKRPADAEKVSK